MYRFNRPIDDIRIIGPFLAVFGHFATSNGFASFSRAMDACLNLRTFEPPKKEHP